MAKRRATIEDYEQIVTARVAEREERRVAWVALMDTLGIWPCDADHRYAITVEGVTYSIAEIIMALGAAVDRANALESRLTDLEARDG